MKNAAATMSGIRRENVRVVDTAAPVSGGRQARNERETQGVPSIIVWPVGRAYIGQDSPIDQYSSEVAPLKTDLQAARNLAKKQVITQSMANKTTQ
jgi:hypothetical protein